MLLRSIIRRFAKDIPAVLVVLSAAILAPGDSCLLAQIEQGQGYVRADQAAIAGIVLGSTEKQVLNALGKPPELRDVPSGGDRAKKVRLYRYPGVDIEVTEGRVSVVRCTAPRYATPDGVRVGDSLIKVLRVYLTTEFDINGDERTDWYGVMRKDAFLVFRYRSMVISEIELCGNKACSQLPP